ncbi:MAG: citG [Clostridiales bacterium]|nr:citG [Clostridiales bacterium]
MGIEYDYEILKKINSGVKLTPEAFKIGEAAILGMLYEVSASPSPGLVSPYSTGVHSDMDFFTFMRSSSSIAYAMYICAQIGMDYPIDDILRTIRSIGIDAEKNMFKATRGINTHRGFLFLGGLVCAAAGYCMQASIELNRGNISSACLNICSGIVDMELKKLNPTDKLSNGERLYMEHGLTGVRGEVEYGLPTVLEIGLPMYEDALYYNLPTAEALCHSLMGIMTRVEDTTVVNRCGLQGLIFMRRLAEIAVEIGGMKTVEGKEFIHDLDRVFEENNISPGGAADLLAITVMIHELEKKVDEL